MVTLVSVMIVMVSVMIVMVCDDSDSSDGECVRW